MYPTVTGLLTQEGGGEGEEGPNWSGGGARGASAVTEWKRKWKVRKYLNGHSGISK